MPSTLAISSPGSFGGFNKVSPPLVNWIASSQFCFSDNAGTIPCNNNDKVLRWKNVNGIDSVQQGNPVNAPTFKVLSFGSVVDFASGNYLYSTYNFPAVTDMTMAAVFTSPVQPAALSRIIDFRYDNSCWLGRYNQAGTNFWGGGYEYYVAPYGYFVNVDPTAGKWVWVFNRMQGLNWRTEASNGQTNIQTYTSTFVATAFPLYFGTDPTLGSPFTGTVRALAVHPNTAVDIGSLRAQLGNLLPPPS